tara:strand:- start:25438 stop:28326 length:2889 start_codon:yes stop_codon:yes gene_type:complete
MIAEIGLITYFTPFLFISMAVAMLVLRAGASRIFFDIVGTMQADKLIKDTKASATIIEALYLDALVGVQEAVGELGIHFTNLMDDVMPIGREIGEAQRQFEKFVSEGEDLAVLNKEIIEIGHSFGFAADESFEAAAKMAQLAGVLGAGSTATGTQMGMAFGLISGMDTEAAMQRMVNLNQQTKFMTEGTDENTSAVERNNKIRENTMRILDQLNTIENTSAATMEQITFVMNQFASQAHLTGESIAAMAAMSAVLIEAGEEQGKGGRALRTIYARLGADTNGARREVERLGVAVIDQNTGAMRPLSEILQDLSVEYQSMEGAEKSALAQTIAGNLHYTRLIKLLEGVDRMRDLEADALQELFPAQEEINRLQDTNLYQLEEMEARLKSVKGALADQLMPAYTDSAKMQAVFHQGMLDIITAIPQLGGVFRIAEIFRTMVAPMVSSYIAIVNLRIATETLRHVRRAMQGEDMFHLTTSNAISDSMTEQAGVIRGQVIPTTNEEIIALEAKIQRYEDLNQRLMQTTQMEEHYADAIKNNNRLIKGHTATLEAGRIEVMRRERMEQQLNNSAINSATMALGGLGTAYLMFGKSQKSMRIGMILNTFAMGIQIVKLLHSTTAQIAETMAKLANTAATNANTGAKNLNILANYNIAASAALARVGITGLTASMITLLGPLGLAWIAAGFLADMFTNVGDEANYMQESMSVSVETVQDIVDEFSLQEINDELAEQRKLVDDLEGATSLFAKGQSDAAKQRISELEEAQAIELLALNSTRAIFEERERLQQEYDEAALRAATTIVSYDADGNPIMGNPETDPATVRAKKALDALEDKNKRIIDIFKTHSVDSLEEIDRFAERTVRSTGEMATDVIEGIADVTGTAVDSLIEFDNAREELFFGFSSSALTGDLIKQVRQQGVENLISNTEVIMTNNFNGMTVPEVADQIIQEIESRANIVLGSTTSMSLG